MSGSRPAWIHVGLNVTGAIALACLAVGVAIQIPLVSTKIALFAATGLGLMLTVVLSGRAKEIFLAGYVVALTYNRQFFVFDAILGNNGSQGLYLVPADLCFAGLVGTWIIEGAMRTASHVRQTTPIAAICMPALAFLIPCIISALFAERPDWAFNELARVIRFTLVLIWLQSNMTSSLWHTAVVSFAVAILLQAGFGTVQVVLHADRNLLSVFGVAGQQVLTRDGEVDLIENRARGTLGHPNYLAPYLLTLIPSCLGVVYYSRARTVRLFTIAVLLVGIAGMVATKSRGPIALCALSLVATSMVAVRERRLSLAAASGGAVFGLVILAILTVVYAQAIYERLWGDFSASITFREQYNSAALSIWDDAPIFGIGLNNLSLGLERHSSWFHQMAVQLEEFRGNADVRAFAPVHNLYLLILAEAGIVGLAGFLVLLASALGRSLNAVFVSEDAVRGMAIGLIIGLLTQFAQQMIDFSLWGDPGWYSLAILMALMGSVPIVRPRIP